MTLLLILKSLYKICTEYGRITAAFCVNFQNNLAFEMDSMDEPHCAIIHFRVFRMDTFIATDPCLRVLSITNKADRLFIVSYGQTQFITHILELLRDHFQKHDLICDKHNRIISLVRHINFVVSTGFANRLALLGPST